MTDQRRATQGATEPEVHTLLTVQAIWLPIEREEPVSAQSAPGIARHVHVVWSDATTSRPTGTP